jgi:hypothetical protein
MTNLEIRTGPNGERVAYLKIAAPSSTKIKKSYYLNSYNLPGRISKY